MDIPDLPKVTILAIPMFITLIVIELTVSRWLARNSFETRDTAASLTMGIGNVITDMMFGFIGAGVLMWASQLAIFDIGYSIPIVVACFLLDDLRFYWGHRISHESRWFWSAHVTHHSSQHYNLSTALRQPWTGQFTGLILLRVPLVVLGFHPVIVAFVGSINLVYQFWIHTEYIHKLPRPIEWIFNTPSHHRVHHATNPRYLDANYAGTLIIWDRLFGTFVPEQDDAPVRYGLVHNIGTFNPIRIALHELVGIGQDVIRPGLTVVQRLGYVFGPPGWSHDGSRMTSAQIKSAAVERRPQLAGRPGLPTRSIGSGQ
ncbi:MAG: sterol desaturase family protein [Myxococcota bacterium]